MTDKTILLLVDPWLDQVLWKSPDCPEERERHIFHIWHRGNRTLKTTLANNAFSVCSWSWCLNNNMPERQGSSALTRTVATLFGNIFAVMAKEEVIAAAKPMASMDLTTKHRLMKAGPSGTRSSNLQEDKKDKTISWCQTGRYERNNIILLSYLSFKNPKVSISAWVNNSITLTRTGWCSMTTQKVPWWAKTLLRFGQSDTTKEEKSVTLVQHISHEHEQSTWLDKKLWQVLTYFPSTNEPIKLQTA